MLYLFCFHLKNKIFLYFNAKEGSLVSKTVLVFSPHPDDAEYSAGGLLSNLILEDAQVLIVVVTDGSKGSFEIPREKLIYQRHIEAENGAKVLGAKPPIFLGYTDLELDLLPTGKLREQFIRLIRQYRPDVVVAPDALTIHEPHPDHRAVALAALEAVNFSNLPLLYPEQIVSGLQPHFVVEKYFYSDNMSVINKIVDITDSFKHKMAALAEHKSQIEFLVEDIRRQAVIAGIDMDSVADAHDSLAAMTWGMQMEAAETGKQAGFLYGEAYHYVRFYPLLEKLMNEA